MSADLAWFGGTFEADDATLAALSDHVAAIATLNAHHLHADGQYDSGHSPPTIAIDDNIQGALSVCVPIIVPGPSPESDEHRARMSAALHHLYGFLLSHFDAPMPDRPMCGAGGLMQPPSFGAVWDDLKGLAPECSLEDAGVKGRASGLARDGAPKTVWLSLPRVVDGPLQAVVDVAAREFEAAHAPATVDRMFGGSVAAIPLFARASDEMKRATMLAVNSVPWAAVTGEHRSMFLAGVRQNEPHIMDAF